jgi:hypothetical protein
MKALKLTACVSVAMFLLPICAISGARAVRQPNIIYINADDMGWTDLSIQGSTYYESPNIDRLGDCQGSETARGQALYLACHNLYVAQPFIPASKVFISSRTN